MQLPSLFMNLRCSSLTGIDGTCIQVSLKIATLFVHTALYGEQKGGGFAEDVLKANQPIWCHLSLFQKQYVLVQYSLIRQYCYSAVM